MSPRRVALVHEDQSWTYAELAAETAAVAGALSALGVRPGDRIGYLGPNHPVFLQAAFAAGLLGAVFVPLNNGLSARDLAYVVRDAGCSVVFYGPEVAGQVAAIRGQVETRGYVAVAPPSSASTDHTLDELLAMGHPATVDLPVGLDDLCFLIYTSGTTGDPKGVMLTHGNVTWNALNYLSTTDFRTSDVTLAIAPLFRAGGWGVTLLPTLQKGGTVVLPSAFDPQTALGLIARHGVTTLFGGPELLTTMVRSPAWAGADLTTMRFVIAGGNIVHEPLIRAYLDRGIPLLQGYGLTEAGPMALMLDESDALRKLGSAGMPPLFVDVHIARSDLTDAPPGELGEILVCGPNVMRGYWGRPRDTEATIVRGWLRTGDAGRMDEEGYVYVVDRMRDLFASQGQTVSPVEVERALAEHETVAEAAVVARRDAHAGHVGVAYVVLRDGAQTTRAALIEHCRERLAPHEVPATVRFVEALPKNPAGKVLKERLSAARRGRPSSLARSHGGHGARRRTAQ
jgi:acyl-CoA synthetase (AMP-forming)/AMP-acid ligase II